MSDVQHIEHGNTAVEGSGGRQAGNRWFQWAVHIGAPLGLSLAVHAVLIVLFSLTTMVAVRSARAGVELDLTPVNAEELAGSDLQWQEAQLPLADEAVPFDSLAPLTDVSEIDTSATDDSPSLGDMGDMLGDGRVDILGTGRGAGPPGSGALGSHFGRGGRAGGRSVRMWDADVIANKIAYVIDFSGSIIVAQDDLVRELKRSVGQLRPPQAFNVYVFYQSQSRVVTENFAQGGLVIAKDDTKAAFNRWIEARQPQGATAPLQAIREALKAEPEVVFFLSDGLFDEEIVAEVTRANRRVGARIICLVFDDALLNAAGARPIGETDGSRRLGRIASQNNGTCKIVTDADLASP